MSSPTDQPKAGKGRTLSYVDALQEAVEQEMDRDPGVFVIGLNVDDHKAIQGTTRGLIDKFGPGRVIDTPLSEDAVTGIVIGAAMAGMRPIHVHIRMDFLMPEMNGLARNTGINAACPEATVIVISGLNAGDEEAAGAAGRIKKSDFSVAALVDILDR